jgi:protein-tyrosine phosphatase
MAKTAVLFVCLGNICRSPLAEAAFRAEAERLGLDVEVDSAGTGGWHAGQPPDLRAISAARRSSSAAGSSLRHQGAPADFDRFDHIVALDRENLEISARSPAGAAPARRCSSIMSPAGGWAVADPYYGGEAGFDHTVTTSARGARPDSPAPCGPAP